MRTPLGIKPMLVFPCWLLLYMLRILDVLRLRSFYISVRDLYNIHNSRPISAIIAIRVKDHLVGCL